MKSSATPPQESAPPEEGGLLGGFLGLCLAPVEELVGDAASPVRHGLLAVHFLDCIEGPSRGSRRILSLVFLPERTPGAGRLHLWLLDLGLRAALFCRASGAGGGRGDLHSPGR